MLIECRTEEEMCEDETSTKCSKCSCSVSKKQVEIKKYFPIPSLHHPSRYHEAELCAPAGCGFNKVNKCCDRSFMQTWHLATSGTSTAAEIWHHLL